ncbi:MAG: alpha-2-macroglobulin, partial [Planctomycetota bacterium]|nr:alpha-2-macroglobulin [Planctomycetota bacterium]
QVSVTPSADEVLPGGEVELAIEVRDETGGPVVGPTVLTAYDRAIEYIAGGSNMDDIRAFFWSWRRSHHPNTQHSLARWISEVFVRNQNRMRSLGVFGNLVAPGDALDGDVGALRQKGQRRGMPMSSAAPMAEMAMAADSVAMEASGASFADAGPGGGEQAAAAPVTTRTDFADSAFWDGRIITDANGKATVRVKLPEDLTTWTIRAWAMGPGTRVGETVSEVITAKHVMVRLQAPRFFIEKDEVVLSANVHNEFDQAITAEVSLAVNEVLALQGEALQQVEIPAHGAVRVDWRVSVVKQGEAVIRMQALSERESDAMEKRFPVKRYGAQRVISRTLAMRGDTTTGTMLVTVPAERDPSASDLIVQVSPSLAASLVEALPYLVSYPYGCTEQTLNRFVPTVMVQKLLTDMDIDLATAAGAERLDAGSLDDSGHEDWRQWQHNPVFSTDEVQDMVRHGVERLADMQVSDGGWGWFSGWGEQSYPHTTAVVVRGLRQAKASGAAVPDGLIAQGHAWLAAYLDHEVRLLQNAPSTTKPWKKYADNLDALVFTVLTDGGTVNEAMQAFLLRDRNHLAVYSKAMLALATHQIGALEQSAQYQRNVEQFVVEDPENQTAWLEVGTDWWYWYGSDNEAMAWYLKLLAKVDPKSDRAAAIAKYLLTNRRHASYWDSTRDTALCIEALAEFMRASEETAFTGTIEILLDDQVVKEVAVTPATLFSIDGQYRISGAAITSGDHVITIRRKGEGAVYANAWLEIFDQQDHIPAEGLEVKVTRQVYRLQRDDSTGLNAGAHGQVLEQRRERYTRELLADGATVRSGDLLEVELSIESKNDYEYLLFEDFKPAGVESVDVRSGYYTDGLRAYRELREDRVALFVQRLARGSHSIAYRVRAEIPGNFVALPAQAGAMYAPE